jgi:murein DD-endopeptidase MepM/ murein hydrolase activator NlpD
VTAGPRFRCAPPALAVLALAVALVPSASFASSRVDDKIHQQQSRIHDVHTKLHEKQAQLESARARVGSIAAQLAETNRNIGRVNGRMQELQGRIKSTQRKLAWNRIQLGAAKATLRRHQDALNRRLVDAYEHGDLGYVDVLLRARSFADFVERWNDIRYLVKSNQSTIRARRADEVKVVAIEGGLLGAATELQGQEAQARQQRLALDALADQRKGLLAAADADRSSVQTQVAQLDEMSAEEEAQLEALIRQKQAEAEAVRAARREAARRAAQLAGTAVVSEETTGAPGSLMWPVSGPITSPFGYRMHPVFHRMILHAGMDIAAATGTTVAAAAGGTVIIAGWGGNCGNMITLDHQGGLSTTYCHLSQIFVGTGQEVQRGQAIGAVGATGDATGPHLHFQVMQNGNPVDPMGYLH